MYYPPPLPHMAPYAQPGYEMYYQPIPQQQQQQQQPPPPLPLPLAQPSPSQGQAVHALPPMPMPQTKLPFPLDPTRTYLLGQLEYYMSVENMAQDLYIRTQVRTSFI